MAPEGDAGYSNTPWLFTKNFTTATWNCETFAQNQNANAIRFGTLYNFRFDSSTPPTETTANIGFFKTGSPISVESPGSRAVRCHTDSDGDSYSYPNTVGYTYANANTHPHTNCDGDAAS